MRAPLLMLSILLMQGCTAPTAPVAQGPRFALGATAERPQAPSVLWQPRAAPPMAALEAAPAPAVSISPTPGPAGGLGGSAPSTAAPAAAGPRPEAYLLSADGRVIAAPDADRVPLPAGLSGLVTYFAPGRVPSTFEAAPNLTHFHPRAVALRAVSTLSTSVRGAVVPPQAGIAVSYHSRGRRGAVMAETAADGSFVLNVPIEGPEEGVVVARHAQDGQHLALSRVQLSAGETAMAQPLVLAGGTERALEMAVPEGLALTGSALFAAENPGPEAWRVPLLAGDTLVPGFELPGFTLGTALSAEASDGSAGSVTAGPEGQLTPFLAPPDLSGLSAELASGQVLAWPEVPGATLYTARLLAVGLTAPVWEGASRQPTLTLPELALASKALTLELTAWDAPDVTIYSVAAMRALRLPTGSSGASGRHSWSRRAYGPASKAR